MERKCWYTIGKQWNIYVGLIIMFPGQALATVYRMADSSRGVRRNKETFSVDIVENTYADKKRWGIVFYGVKSKLLAYDRLGSKDPTGS